MIAANTDRCKVTAMMIQPRGTEGAAVYTIFWQLADGREEYRATDAASFWYTLHNLPTPVYEERNYWSWGGWEVL